MLSRSSRAWMRGPLCLATKDPDEIINVVTAVAPVFGGINLEDISAPRCFEIERPLDVRSRCRSFTTQHGTAIVVLAALLNALRVVNKSLKDVHVVIAGVGAAGPRQTSCSPPEFVTWSAATVQAWCLRAVRASAA